MNPSPITVNLSIDASAVNVGAQYIIQSLLVLECRRYSKLSDTCKRSPIGQAIYKRMKSLNETVLTS